MNMLDYLGNSLLDLQSMLLVEKNHVNVKNFASQGQPKCYTQTIQFGYVMWHMQMEKMWKTGSDTNA